MARKLFATALVLLVFVPSASATLRSPRLESSCPAGYTYGEHDVGKWRVEGCAKAGTASGDVVEKWTFDGDVEASGLKIEPASGSADLIATEEQVDEGSLEYTIGRLKRTESTRLVLDPQIGSSRREFTLYTGSVDLIAENNAQLVRTSLTGPIVHAAGGASSTAATLDELPVSGTPSLLGMRVRDDDIADAQVSTSEMTFEVSLSLGSAAPDLLDDFLNTNTIEVTLEDGDGMQPTDLVMRIRDIAIEGIGGLENLRVEYDSGDDAWSGSVKLDLGSVFPRLDFEMEVSASNGSILYIRAKADNLSIPIGATGITLDAVEAAFGLDPLFVQAGVGVTAGPKVAGVGVIAASGTLRIELEPSFRLEASGTLRLLPAGNGELARGTAAFVYDSDGYIAVSGDAYFEATVFDVGIGASIGGSGEYSTTNDHFNIEAHATGTLILGFLGDVPIVHLEAVVSSNGWAACGEVVPPFISGGIGQDWDRGMELLLGCSDMSDYDANVPGARSAQAGVRPFAVPPGTTKLGIDVTTDQPGRRVRLRAPDGSVRLQTEPGMRGPVDGAAAVVAPAGKNRQYIVVMNPPAGRWGVLPEPGASITALRLQRNAPALRATARATGNRIQVRRTSELGPGETLQVGVRSRRGVRPVGAPSAAAQFAVVYDSPGDTGTHEVVAQVMRNGVPLPKRRAVIGRLVTRAPKADGLRVRRRGRRLSLTAVNKGVTASDDWEAPVAHWAYTLRGPGGGRVSFRAAAGKPVTVAVGRKVRSFVAEVRPIVRGRILKGAVYRRTVRLQRRVR